MRVGLYRFVRDVLVRPLSRVLFRVEVRGEIPGGPCVVVSNHESVLDPLVLSLAAREPVRFMAKEELWRRRWSGRLMEALGAFPVSRGRGDREALARAVALLREGAIVGLFPEGTVHGGPWQRGAAKVALLTGAPVVPVRLEGTGRALAGARLRPVKVRVTVGAPVAVDAAAPTVASAKALTERLRRAVAVDELVGPQP